MLCAAVSGLQLLTTSGIDLLCPLMLTTITETTLFKWPACCPPVVADVIMYIVKTAGYVMSCAANLQ